MARGYSISINGGAAQSMDDAGWSLGTISLVNQGPDTTRLTRGRARRGQSLGLAYGDKVLIQRESDGRRVFYGTVSSLPVRYDAGALTAEAVISGPWYDLERRTFARGPFGLTFTIGQVVNLYGTDYKVATADNFAATPPEININWLMSAKGYLYDPIYSPSLAYRTMSIQAEELVDYQVSVAGANVTFTKGAITPGNAIPRYRTITDNSVGQALQNVLAADPTVAAWFDYRTDPLPTLNITALGSEDTLVLGQPPLLRLDATPRQDLIPSGIVIRHQYSEPTDVYDRGFTGAFAMDRYPATAVMTDEAVMTISQDQAEGAGAGGYNVATDMYNAVATLRATGSLDLYDPDLDLQIRPGLAYRVTGDDAVASAQLLVQAANWNPKTGTWSCTLGYPRHLDMQHYRDMRGWLNFSYWVPGALVFGILPPPPNS